MRKRCCQFYPLSSLMLILFRRVNMTICSNILQMSKVTSDCVSLLENQWRSPVLTCTIGKCTLPHVGIEFAQNL